MKIKTLDEILLDVNTELLPEREELYGPWLDTPEEEVEEDMVGMYQAVVANNKITEADDVIPVIKGTRKPTNRGDRRDLTDKAKANAIRKAYCSHKGGYTVIYRGENGETKVKSVPISEWLAEGKKAFWKNVKAAKKTGNRQRFDQKKADSKKHRHEGKGVCRDYTEDDYLSDLSDMEYLYDVDVEKGYIKEDDFDPDFNPWGYTDEEKYYLNQNYLHGDFSDEETEKIIHHRDLNRKLFNTPDFDDYYDEDYEYRRYWNADIHRHVIVKEITRVGELKKEIATYKDFLGEFNLNTLYERWLAERKKQFSIRSRP